MRTLYELGELRLDPEARVLTRSGAPVTLGARAVAVLAALVGRANEYVPKAEIMDAAWPGLVVEEANLAVQISAIRRALAQVVGGEGWIETLARRGYRFVGPVAVIAGRAGENPAPFDRTRTNLPQVLTSFVGREREIAEIKRLLPQTRLLTLTGTGGIGKTRLALQAAAEVLDAYGDGIWFVDLAPLNDPALVPSALAQVLGVKESAGQSLKLTLCAHLRTKEMLLVLDNCEHLLGSSADIVDVIVRDTPSIAIIATSREPLHVASEKIYPVNALSLPDPKAEATAIVRSDAVQLFLDRARQLRSRFDLEGPRARAAAMICVRLDGLPLALELAAARIAVLPVEEIERLLDQRFRLLTRGDGNLPRQQTLRAMLDWSYELLDTAEQQLFARLSVFVGGWTIAAAKAVGETEAIAPDDVVYLLIALIEKSLVVADENGDRYRMLETVRAYAKEKLAVSGDAATVQNRHRDHFVALAEEMKPKLMGAEQALCFRRLEEEHDNMRTALDWSLVATGSEAGLRLCAALQWFWITRGYVAEGRQWCARALAKDGAEEGTSARATVLNAEALMAAGESDYAAARTLHGESLAIRRQLGDRSGVATLLNNLGLLAWHQGELAEARSLLEESLAIMRELANRQGTANALNNLGNVAQVLGDLVSARTLQEESLVIMRDLGDRRGTAVLLDNLGELAIAQGDYESAKELFEESLVIARELGFREGIARSLCCLGELAEGQGNYPVARILHEESLVIRQELGDKAGIADSLEDFAAMMAVVGGARDAARVLGAAERLREEVGSPLPPSERPRYDQRVAAVCNAMGDEPAFDRAWQEGRALTLEQATELALRESVDRR